MRRNHQLISKTTYEIKVKGVLDPKWSDWFDGFTIIPGDDETVLTGKVIDQAALHGLLAKINDLGLQLISLNLLPIPED